VPTLKLYYDGWLALPADVRKKLSLTTGDRLNAELVDGALVLRPSANAAPEVRIERETASAPDGNIDNGPAKRKPGRPRKTDLPTAAPPEPAPKRARGRPRKAAPTTLHPPESSPMVRSVPWKLVKKADLQPAAATEEQVPPSARRSARLGSYPGAEIVERRPFRNVEVRKLEPGRGHSKRRTPPAFAHHSG
jgi:antitoxin component of MazEF toxin-antitoxin module